MVCAEDLTEDLDLLTKEFGEYPKLMFIGNERLRFVAKRKTAPVAIRSGRRPAANAAASSLIHAMLVPVC